MRKVVMVLVVAAQLGVLGFMAGEREWVVRTGRTVYLRTAPIDPQDPMRGDYVRLNYDLAIVPKNLCRDGVLEWFKEKNPYFGAKIVDRRVYAEVSLDSEGLAELVALSDRPPAQGIYLRGRANVMSPGTIAVRYGVEALFMQQGKASAFETVMRTEKVGVPLNIELAVSPGGLAVIKGYRWEPLGITLTLDRPPPTTQPRSPSGPRPGLRGVTVELKNHGAAPVAIVDAPGTHCLRLVPNRNAWGVEESGWNWTQEDAPRVKGAAASIVVLQPGESHRVHLDFTSPEWFVWKKQGNLPGQPVSLETLANDWSASFRIEYAPPSAFECTGLPHAELIRHARLRSRRFGAAGSVD